MKKVYTAREQARISRNRRRGGLASRNKGPLTNDWMSSVDGNSTLSPAFNQYTNASNREVKVNRNSAK